MIEDCMINFSSSWKAVSKVSFHFWKPLFFLIRSISGAAVLDKSLLYLRKIVAKQGSYEVQRYFCSATNTVFYSARCLMNCD